jgi:hypothetical protein
MFNGLRQREIICRRYATQEEYLLTVKSTIRQQPLRKEMERRYARAAGNQACGFVIIWQIE